MRLYDTLSRQIKPLKAADGVVFRFYCCGPTVYGPAHIGNFRTFIAQDVLRRALEADGLKVRHVRNITDVDDKTIRQSQAEGRSLAEFTEAWTKKFHEDCEALGLLAPHAEPGAVAHIQEQIALIEDLIARGHAYEKNGSVYFRVGSFENYGRLSRLKEREIRTAEQRGAENAAETQAEDADEYVRDSSADFALWKARKPEDGNVFWQSPWGQGRPGWHIECSAMSLKYCGPGFDLHGGGADLIFPHHENEIAQSECATGATFVHHWMHTAHLMVEGAKMSKSLGNLHTVADVCRRGFDPSVLRYALMSGHYRQPLNFTWETLEAARSAVHRLARMRRLFGVEGQQTDAESGWGVFEKFWHAMNDDLNVPAALGHLFAALNTMGDPHALDEAVRQKQGRAFERVLFVLGLEKLREQNQPDLREIPAEAKLLAEKRWQARLARDWKTADALRNELAALGWTMKDGRDGYELVAARE